MKKITQEFSPEVISRLEKKIQEAIAAHPSRSLRIDRIWETLALKEDAMIILAVALVSLVIGSLVY